MIWVIQLKKCKIHFKSLRILSSVFQWNTPLITCLAELLVILIIFYLFESITVSGTSILSVWSIISNMRDSVSSEYPNPEKKALEKDMKE